MNGLIPRDEAVLVVIDLQEKLFPLIFNQAQVLENSLKVIEFCRRLDIPIVVTEQYPKGLGSTLTVVQEALGDAYKPIPKTTFSCFGEPEFTRTVASLGRNWLIIVGIETHVCVAQTVLTGMNLYVDDHEDFDPGMLVLADCVGSRTPLDHSIGIDRLRDEGVFISTSDAFYYEMLVEAKTDAHKKVFALLK